MSERIQTYAAFWPFYLGEHSDPRCRALHFIGTTGHLALVGVALVTLNPLWLLASAISGYGFAWPAHFLIEKNRPATFKYPLWSLLSDYRMWLHMVTGKLWTGRDPAAQVGAAPPSQPSQA
jgi:hypothetical protein